jgi:hypothetical protein
MPQTTQTTVTDNPSQFFQIVEAKKDRIAQLPEKAQQRFYRIAFKKFLLPRLTASGLDPKSMDEAEAKFTSRMMGKKTEPFSRDFGKPPVEDERASLGEAARGTVDELKNIGKLVGTGKGFEPNSPGGAFLEGGYAKLAGMVKNLEGLNERLDDYIAKIPGLKKIGEADKRLSQGIRKQAAQEESTYDLAKGAHPTAAGLGGAMADLEATGGIFTAPSHTLQAVKNPLLRHALGGAAGAMAVAPYYGTKSEDLPMHALTGAAGNLLIGPLGNLLAGRGSVATRRIMSRGPAKTVSAATSDLDALAQESFKKPWASTTPQERQQLIQAYTAKTKAAAQEARKPKSVQASTPTPKEAVKPTVAPKDSPEQNKWRQQQYQKLRRAGVDPRTQRDQVHAGRTAEEILAKQAGGSVGEHVAAVGIAAQETPEVGKAVKGVKSVTEVITPKDHLDSIKKELRGQYPNNSEEAIDKAAREQLAHENKVEKQTGRVVRVPEGQHGTGDIGKKAVKAEKEAAARAKAASAQPSQEVGYEGSGKEGKGTPVPITPTEIPLVELISGIKSFKHEGLNGARLAQTLERDPRWGKLDDVEKRAALEKMYQAYATKVGVEGATNKSIDELYVTLQHGH